MDTTHLRRLLDASGPFASVYVDDPHSSEDAAKQRALIARAVHAELEHKGAERELCAIVDECLNGSTPASAHAGRAVLATLEGVIVDQPLMSPLGWPTYRYSPLPFLLPLVTDSSAGSKYICVFVDAEGADFTVSSAAGEELETNSIVGGAGPVHKVASGGTREYHDTAARAEENIRQNIASTAQAVMEVADRHRGAPIFVIGEVRSRAQLIAELPSAAQPRLASLESGSRARGSDSVELRHELGEHLLRRELQTMQDAADQFAHAAGSQPPLASQGLPAVAQALREANVETLFVTERTDAAVYVGDQPTLVAANPIDIDMGRSRMFECRADEALPFAAVAVGSAIVGMDQRLGLEHGFGAVLRHPSA